MKEKIKDTIVDLLFDGVKEKLDCVKENYKWQKLFVSTGDFFVNNPDVLVKFEDDLYSVFSKDNLIRIAKRLKDNNGYDFSQLLHNELYDLMVSYEIPIMETETYIHHFMQVIITYLEENDSDKALEMFLGDMRKEIGTYFAALESKLELVLNQISNLNKEKITTYSIADIDAQIRRETKYKGMGLDFFKLDDEQFESKFQNSLNDTKVYVVGKSREETTYRILNELKNKNSKRITLVVKSEKEWNKLQHSNLSGNILVPFFYADSIVVIPNNTNIFIYGEDEPCYTQNKLVLRKRTKRNIIDSLEELGIDARSIAWNDGTNREGHAAKVYFNALFGLEFTRTEDNLINAALNYGYSIILSAFTREIVANGYITQLGVFHDNMFNQFNLASDLMEPFRILVDRQVLTMKLEQFEHEEKMQLVNVLNQEVQIDGKIQYVNNAIKIYCKSIFDALSGDDSSLIRFYRIEL